MNLAFVCVPLLTISRATFVPNNYELPLARLTRGMIGSVHHANCFVRRDATSVLSAEMRERESLLSCLGSGATSSRPCRSRPSKGADNLNCGTAGVAAPARRRPDGARCMEGDGGPGATVRVQGAARVGASSVGTTPWQQPATILTLGGGGEASASQHRGPPSKSRAINRTVVRINQRSRVRDVAVVLLAARGIHTACSDVNDRLPFVQVNRLNARTRTPIYARRMTGKIGPRRGDTTRGTRDEVCGAHLDRTLLKPGVKGEDWELHNTHNRLLDRHGIPLAVSWRTAGTYRERTSLHLVIYEYSPSKYPQFLALPVRVTTPTPLRG